MAEEKKYRNYTAVDIEKYHKGLLSSKEMHELERASLDDPFLADALEGYGHSSATISSDLSDLGKRLQERISGTKLVQLAPSKYAFKWWKAAAAVIIIGGVGFLTFRISKNNANNTSMARLEEKKSNQTIPPTGIDSNKTLTKETTNIVRNDKPSGTTVAKSLKTRTPDTVSVITNDGEAATITKSDAPVLLNYRKQNTDSVNEKKVAPGDYSALGKVKNIANNKLGEESAASSEKQAGIKDQERMNYFHGHVMDTNYNPLPFANITSTRYNVGTYADAQGNFTLISTDSVLDVQVRSVGFENNFARLKNNITSNQLILHDDNAVADKILSFQKRDTSHFANGSMRFEEPEPADGWTNYSTYLANNINVPDNLKLNSTGGQVKLSFEVNQNGEPVDIKVEKSLCQKCDEEAVRLIREGPKWKKKARKVQRVTVTVPFDTDQ